MEDCNDSMPICKTAFRNSTLLTRLKNVEPFTDTAKSEHCFSAYILMSCRLYKLPSHVKKVSILCTQGSPAKGKDRMRCLIYGELSSLFCKIFVSE